MSWERCPLVDHIRFDSGGMTLIVACAANAPPHILYWGKQLTQAVGVDQIRDLTFRQHAWGSEDKPIVPSLAMEPGVGFMGLTGLSAHRDGKDWGSRFCVISADRTGSVANIKCRDAVANLSLEYSIDCDPITGVLEFASTLRNDGTSTLSLNDMATACLPIQAEMTDIIGFSGRWADEFRRERLNRFSGTYLRENRRGRTSHDSFPAVILCSPDTQEQCGEAFGLHLAWSGNHRIRVDTVSDGSVYASLGALLFPGEIQLAVGESYSSPPIVAAYSGDGFSLLSRKFHSHVREKLLRPVVRNRPRPVHYNCWEAVYFDHDLDQLKEMASKAAEIGVERFVLDDGWFGSRRNDKSGLGDWTVSRQVYPDGLKPLIDHVTDLGMEMGIWFEPEMVNPDSDLYRAHPDWILQVEGSEQVQFRHQYALDISRADVADYLFERIDAILRDHNIGYVKWDMNRDLNHPGGQDGAPHAFAQVKALYDLIDRIRDAHPNVEIESCASGGGRADMGILAHTDRIWTSDSNDALDRQSIQAGASYFLPLEVLGAHVGPRRCHITGRTLSMNMRAATALMGHMGLELNLLTEPQHELAQLKSALALYKRHRSLLHSGDLYRLDIAAPYNVMGVVAADKSEALYSIACLEGHRATRPPTVHFDGLDEGADYRIQLVWPEEWQSLSSPSVVDAMQLREGNTLSGESLAKVGMQLPIGFPETVILIYLHRA